MHLAHFAFRPEVFRRAEGGNFAIIFGLLLIPVAAISGLSLDYARVRGAQQQLQSAVDVAALAAASATGQPVAHLQQLVADFVEANADGYDIDVQTSVDGNQLTVEASTVVPTPLLSLTSNLQTQVSFKAVVVRNKAKTGGSVGAGASQTGDGQTADEEALRRKFVRELGKLPHHVRERLERKYAAMLRMARNAPPRLSR